VDRRALPSLVSGLLGLAFGVSAAVFHMPALGIMSGFFALSAAADGLIVLRQTMAAEKALASATAEIHQAREALAEVDANELQSRARPLDPETGLPDGHWFELTVESRVAAARRHLWPVTIVLLDLSLDVDPRVPSARKEVLAGFSALMRQTLREADIACRTGPTSFGLVLEDTSEEGGVWTAERLQIALARDGIRVRRLAAGVASYPTHGLRADDVLARAQLALGRACAAHPEHGLGQVEVATVDLA
jgi:diguanylate cyclase (GGDEF)-like protein